MRNLAIQCESEREDHYRRIFDLCSFFNIDFFQEIDLAHVQYRYSSMVIENYTGEGLIQYKHLICSNEYTPKTVIVQAKDDIKLGIEFARLGVEGLIADDTHPLDMIEIIKKVDLGGIYYSDVFLKEILKNLQLDHFRHELSVA